MFPVAAGALAYALTPDRANAATGGPTGNITEAATNAAAVGGTAYGTGKLAQALGPNVMKALRTANEATLPSQIEGMTNYSPDELAQGRNFLARNLPQAMQFGEVAKARDMAQVPSPGARDDASMIARARDSQAQDMPLPSAAALRVPADIPAPDPSGAPPGPPSYGPNIDGRLKRMISLGAPPQAIVDFLNQAVR
jgi:hypothetical protein